MRNEQTSQKFDSETWKLQPVNLSEASRDTAGVHQRTVYSSKVHNVSSFGSKCNDRLINGLLHTKCLDGRANEDIVVLKLALSE